MKNLSQHGPSAAANIHDGAYSFPTSADLNIRAGVAVACRPNQRVEAGGNVGIDIQIFPKRPAKDLAVRELAGADEAQQGSPGVCEPPANAVEIERELPNRVEQLAGSFVQRELAERRLQKDALANLAAAAISTILVVPSAIRSAIRSMATTWMHQGVRRSLSAARSAGACSGIGVSPAYIEPTQLALQWGWGAAGPRKPSFPARCGRRCCPRRAERDIFGGRCPPNISQLRKSTISSANVPLHTHRHNVHRETQSARACLRSRTQTFYTAERPARYRYRHPAPGVQGSATCRPDPQQPA